MASSMNWEAARDRLRKLREEQHRCSDEVVSLWEDVLCANSYRLGDELWMVHEQVCIAALDCGNKDVAMMNLHALQEQFPNSMRVRRLRGLFFESQENYDKALKIYDAILDIDETNTLIRKRKIAILKAKDDIRGAIKELNVYVERFMSDYEAWMELCDLYLQEQDYTKAAFCLEELIMSNPHSHLYHEKYAEIKYTQGGIENMCTARRYFAQSLKLNPNNMRALYGLFLSASNVASSKSKDAKTKKDNIKYAAWAAEQITKQYKEVARKKEVDTSSQLTSILHMMDEIQITQTS
ncbi:hypothetical protein LSH36_174g04008 [Paralvinella palmiformis]|uniref:ER membrane protein complex subunit 2 n=1 Tax=Paralvinella palmiformis TaxID=53620 RepID=A0AAD9N7F7_9ANNE|nr:hypothetical protein LSH36_174g04008 [Paralvinella palmiformis]